jgi:uncharacterized membrane protein YbhN (UPF0104 family)
MFSILFLFGIATMLVDVSDRLQSWGMALASLALVAGAGVISLRLFEATALRVVARLCAVLPERLGGGVQKFVAGFIEALSMLDGPVAFARALGWSLFLWFVISLLAILGFAAFHLDVPTATAALVATTVVAIAVSVPSAPGFIGSYQLGWVLALAIFGIAESEAVALSIVLHLTQFVAVIGAGLYSLWMTGMTLREVEAEAAE